MSDLSLLALIISILFFTCGIVLFVRFFPWKIRKPQVLFMKVVFDVNDYASFDAIMQIISSYDLIGADYHENEDVSFITLDIPKEEYESLYKSLRTLTNVEVI